MFFVRFSLNSFLTFSLVNLVYRVELLAFYLIVFTNTILCEERVHFLHSVPPWESPPLAHLEQQCPEPEELRLQLLVVLLQDLHACLQSAPVLPQDPRLSQQRFLLTPGRPPGRTPWPRRAPVPADVRSGLGCLGMLPSEAPVLPLQDSEGSSSFHQALWWTLVLHGAVNEFITNGSFQTKINQKQYIVILDILDYRFTQNIIEVFIVNIGIDCFLSSYFFF